MTDKVMNCSICSCEFTEDESGVIGEFGMMPVAFCPTCFTSMLDMADQFNIKEWEGLTDEEYQAIRYGYDENGERNVEYELFDEGEYGMEVNIYVDDFARAIEAKLKEKNT